MVAIACAASASVVSRIVAKRCGSSVWSMMPTDQPSGSTQMVRVCLPSTFMVSLITRFAAARQSATLAALPARAGSAMSIRSMIGGSTWRRSTTRPSTTTARACRSIRRSSRAGMRDAEDYRTEAMKRTARRARALLRIDARAQTIDLFRPASAAQGAARAVHPRRLLALARPLDVQPHGARASTPTASAVAVAGYDLCPQVTIADIIEADPARAAVSLWQRTGQRVMVYGHSAGGHLAAAMLATDWHGALSRRRRPTWCPPPTRSPACSISLRSSASP